MTVNMNSEATSEQKSDGPDGDGTTTSTGSNVCVEADTSSLPVPVPGPKPAGPEPVSGPSFCPNPAPATAPETVPEMQAQADSDSPKTSLGCCEIQSLTGSEMLSRAKKRAHKRLTNNLLEGLCFHSDALHFIQSDPDYFGKDAIEVILAACQDDTMSTSFSGIEAPHTASCANLAEFLGIDQKLVPMPRLLHMIEWDVQNRAELMIIAHQTGSCLFGDIASFFRKELQETIQMIKDTCSINLVVGHWTI